MVQLLKDLEGLKNFNQTRKYLPEVKIPVRLRITVVSIDESSTVHLRLLHYGTEQTGERTERDEYSRFRSGWKHR